MTPLSSNGDACHAELLGELAGAVARERAGEEVALLRPVFLGQTEPLQQSRLTQTAMVEGHVENPVRPKDAISQGGNSSIHIKTSTKINQLVVGHVLEAHSVALGRDGLGLAHGPCH